MGNEGVCQKKCRHWYIRWQFKANRICLSLFLILTFSSKINACLSLSSFTETLINKLAPFCWKPSSYLSHNNLGHSTTWVNRNIQRPCPLLHHHSIQVWNEVLSSLWLLIYFRSISSRVLWVSRKLMLFQISLSTQVLNLLFLLDKMVWNWVGSISPALVRLGHQTDYLLVKSTSWSLAGIKHQVHAKKAGTVDATY